MPVQRTPKTPRREDAAVHPDRENRARRLREKGAAAPLPDWQPLWDRTGASDGKTGVGRTRCFASVSFANLKPGSVVRARISASDAGYWQGAF
jgi:hypothetical protein